MQNIMKCSEGTPDHTQKTIVRDKEKSEKLVEIKEGSI